MKERIFYWECTKIDTFQRILFHFFKTHSLTFHSKFLFNSPTFFGLPMVSHLLFIDMRSLEPKYFSYFLVHSYLKEFKNFLNLKKIQDNFRSLLLWYLFIISIFRHDSKKSLLTLLCHFADTSRIFYISYCCFIFNGN